MIEDSGAAAASDSAATPLNVYIPLSAAKSRFGEILQSGGSGNINFGIYPAWRAAQMNPITALRNA